MLSKPVKWRRVGMTALAGVSLTLTALAAQVSPPNIHMPPGVRTADAPAAGGATAKPEGVGSLNIVRLWHETL